MSKIQAHWAHTHIFCGNISFAEYRIISLLFYSFANVGLASREKFICLSQMRVLLFKKEIINCDWIDLNLVALDRLTLIYYVYVLFSAITIVCGCVTSSC